LATLLVPWADPHDVCKETRSDHGQLPRWDRGKHHRMLGWLFVCLGDNYASNSLWGLLVALGLRRFWFGVVQTAFSAYTLLAMEFQWRPMLMGGIFTFFVYSFSGPLSPAGGRSRLGLWCGSRHFGLPEGRTRLYTNRFIGFRGRVWMDGGGVRAVVTAFRDSELGRRDTGVSGCSCSLFGQFAGWLA